jgi:nicotinamide riboside transporter PnuC
MMKILEYVMFLGAVVGSLLLASNSDYSKIGYIFFTVSSIAGIFVSYKFGVKSMMWTQIYFTLINLYGIMNWY